ncbi:MAG TPA: nuclear transport factor 2 family protein [Terriglobia bacterium]|nr:nuclear transport factor 2 family protein [Terriglobia bacterium]
MILNPAGTRMIRLVLGLAMALVVFALLLSGSSTGAGSQPDVVSARSDIGTDAKAIKALIAKYALSIGEADTGLASQIWLDSPEVSFIHPLGHEHGLDQIKDDVYRHLMGDTFSERRLSTHDFAVHLHGDSAWAEFYWDFTAKYRKNGSTVTTHGRETQVYWKEQGRWRLVHVHYSAMPVTEQRKGF